MKKYQLKTIKFNSLPTNSWNSLIQASPPPSNPPTVLQMAKYLKGLADRILLDKGRPFGSKRLPAFANWWDMVNEARNAAGQGITVGGTVSQEVTIENNTIEGFTQGIHLGVSHRAAPRRTPSGSDSMKRVVIQENNILVLFVPSATRTRHGIFVGNCESLLIRNNYMELQNSLGLFAGYIRGIHVFGYLGRMILIRENHLDHFPVGITVQPLNNLGTTKAIWIVSDNLTAYASQPVEAPSPPVVITNNIS